MTTQSARKRTAGQAKDLDTAQVLWAWRKYGTEKFHFLSSQYHPNIVRAKLRKLVNQGVMEVGGSLEGCFPTAKGYDLLKEIPE